LGIAQQVIQMRGDLAAQTGGFLRQNDAEFGDQAA
jgi:hypothetical protein